MTVNPTSRTIPTTDDDAHRPGEPGGVFQVERGGGELVGGDRQTCDQRRFQLGRLSRSSRRIPRVVVLLAQHLHLLVDLFGEVDASSASRSSS
jgi:hypothetical protein